MNIAVARGGWLRTVLHQEEDDALKAQFDRQKSDGGPDNASSTASSRDAGSAARAGPCPGFEKLESFKMLEEHGSKISTCTDLPHLKELTTEKASLRKVFAVLQQSCKQAVTDLRGARAKKLRQEEIDKEKAKKDK